MNNPAHAFEQKGLGAAPFQFVRVIRNKKTTGRCASCGKAIANECVVKSADGKEFTVGKDCVRKTGDFGLGATIEAEFKKLEELERTAVIVQAEKLLAMDVVMAAIKAKPHPSPFHASQGKTLMDWVAFANASGGKAKKAEVALSVLQVAKELGLSDEVL